jgi:hypothetical protein
MKYQDDSGSDFNFDILIPTQHNAVAKQIIDYAQDVIVNAISLNLGNDATYRIARELARAKYWEAYDCKDEQRQEYWRVVMNCLS